MSGAAKDHTALVTGRFSVPLLLDANQPSCRWLEMAASGRRSCCDPRSLRMLARQWLMPQARAAAACHSSTVHTTAPAKNSARRALSACRFPAPVVFRRTSERSFRLLSRHRRAVRPACVRAGMPVTVKCRIGVDDNDSYEELCAFVGEVSRRGGVRHFIIHARKVWGGDLPAASQ